MIRLTFHMLVRIALVAGALMGFMLAGRTEQPPALSRIRDFTVCVLPCWAGVTPLETAFDRAAGLMDSNLAFREMDFRSNNAQIGFSTTQGVPQIYGVIYGDRGQVNALRLEISLPVWMLLDGLGTPTCARTVRLANTGKDSMTVYWEGETHTLLSVLLLGENEVWNPGAPTRYLFITAFNNECALLNAPAWQGFAQLWRYRVE